ncbi:sulfatase-like hydrolase/transferase [Arthrobacter sp. AOP36-A1-22]|uniref:sulfatase-like hydrolase/transferase n=1 Tax=Arthrobacter sp. AOP36-A1-22 TaxID=3457684 RepID=UPI004033EECD
MSSPILHATRRVGVITGRILIYALIFAGLSLLFAAIGIRIFFGKISVGQMLLNLVSVETDGGGGSLVWIGILLVVVLPLLITVGIAVWHYSWLRKRFRNPSERRPRRSPWFVRTVSTVAVAGLVVGGTTAFSSTVGMADYIKSGNSQYDIDDYYVEPTITSDKDQRNLVVIYLESGEATLADDQLFEKNAFEPLQDVTQAKDGWQSVEDFQQYEGGGWTMSGITSTQCGIPLKGMDSAVGSGALNKLGSDVESYLGGITCLGDILDDHGYKNVFLGGANGKFSAKDTFLEGHGYSDVKGLTDWRAAGEPASHFRSDWGLSDKSLMSHAEDEIDELHAESKKSGQPFNLSMLTLDTHEPAHIYDYCDQDTESEVTSMFFCSMTQVAGFVDYMEDKGYLDDTAVVIMGDHLKHMGGGDAFHEELDDHPNRTIFNRFWIPGEDKKSEMRPRVDQLNLYPTLLEAAGLKVKNHEAGLGVSAFTSDVPEDSAQAMEPDDYADLLKSRSARFFAKAWAGADIPQQ